MRAAVQAPDMRVAEAQEVCSLCVPRAMAGLVWLVGRFEMGREFLLDNLRVGG